MTVKEFLEGMAGKNQSDERESAMMQNILRRVAFPEAVVTCGIVYLEGKGTMEAPPMSIHAVAQMILASKK